MSYDETISTREDDYEEHDTEYPDEKEKKLTEYDPEVSEEYNADIYDTADEGNIYNEKMYIMMQMHMIPKRYAIQQMI